MLRATIVNGVEQGGYRQCKDYLLATGNSIVILRGRAPQAYDGFSVYMSVIH